MNKLMIALAAVTAGAPLAAQASPEPVRALCRIAADSGLDRASAVAAYDEVAATCGHRARELDGYFRRGAPVPSGLTLEGYACASLARLAGEESGIAVEATSAVARSASGCRGAEATSWRDLTTVAMARVSRGELPPVAEAPPEPDYTWAWVSGGVSLAALVAGSVLVADAVGVSERLELEQARGAHASLLEDLHARRTDELGGGLGLLAIGTGALGVAIWQLVDPPLDAPRTSPTLVPTVSSSGAGVLLSIGGL
jgi:hypothetical protein